MRGILLLTFALLLICDTAFAQQPSSRDYLRLRVDSQTNEPIALETAIQQLRGKDDYGEFFIDLIAAVHIAEKSYFGQLNSIFVQYHALLYELIARPEDLDHSKSNQSKLESDSVVSMGQKAMRDLLGLSFQLDEIDYSKPNFVHADFSPEQLSKAMSDRGESLFGLWIKSALNSASNSNNTNTTNLSDLVLFGFGRYRAIALRRTLARQFNDIDKFLEVINGQEGSSIIGDRNQHAVDIAKKTLNQNTRKIAIFYGAAHLPDLNQRLSKQLKTQVINSHWLEAWDLRTQSQKK